MLVNILLVAIGGACGAVTRWALSSGVQAAAGNRFFVGTLAANWVGCFMFGLIIQLIGEQWRLHPQARLLLLTGFMGAFTTFSTYAFEAALLFQHPDGRWVSAVAHIVLHNVIGIALIFVGLATGGLLRST